MRLIFLFFSQQSPLKVPSLHSYAPAWKKIPSAEDT